MIKGELFIDRLRRRPVQIFGSSLDNVTLKERSVDNYCANKARNLARESLAHDLPDGPTHSVRTRALLLSSIHEGDIPSQSQSLVMVIHAQVARGRRGHGPR